MNILNRYLFGQFIRHFFTVNMAFVAIYLLIDFFEKFDDFNEAGKPLSMALRFFILSVPAIVDQLGPVFILLAGVISLGLLAHSNELTALKAGGVPLVKIITPLIAAAVLFTLLFMAAAQWLLPITVAKTNSIWYEQLKGKVPLGIMRNNRYYYKGRDGFYSFAWPNTKKRIFHNFSYSTWDEQYNVKEMVTARYAAWIVKEEKWKLSWVQVQKKDKNGAYTIINYRRRFFSFHETPDDFLVPVNKSAEYSLGELFLETMKAEDGQEKEHAWGVLLSRISYLLLGLPLLLTGLPLLLYSYRKWGRDLSVAIPVSCGLAFVAWGLWGALQSLATAGYLSPIIAAGALHILFGCLGWFFLRFEN